MKKTIVGYGPPEKKCARPIAKALVQLCRINDFAARRFSIQPAWEKLAP
jgi:hypothetical protein